jgi:hypothetical protein
VAASKRQKLLIKQAARRVCQSLSRVLQNLLKKEVHHDPLLPKVPLLAKQNHKLVNVLHLYKNKKQHQHLPVVWHKNQKQLKQLFLPAHHP